MLKIPIMWNSFKAGDFNFMKINLHYKAASFRYFRLGWLTRIPSFFSFLNFNFLEISKK